MRFFYIALVLVTVASLTSCKDGDATTTTQAPSPVTNVPSVNDPGAAPPISSSGGVEHYTCPNGHLGSGASGAGTCSQCGATLEHNAGFHNTPPPDDLANQSNITPSDNSNSNSGVEHYTCPNGHLGSGGGAAGTCSQCGATLDHNAEFHNTPPPADLQNQTNNELTVSPTTEVGANSGVEHYICPNGHVGSGGSGEGSCSQCQALLVHNEAFHSNDPVSISPTSPPINSGAIIPQPSGAVSPVFQNAGGPIEAPTFGNVPNLEPAKNANGVWHYVCEDGHGGGAGSASACSICGKTLVHNAGYH